MLALSVSHGALNSGKIKMKLVKEEELSICNPLKWSGFLSVLDLSSVCLCFVYCYYKSYDTVLKCLISSLSQENFLLLIQRQVIYYFVTIVLSLQLHFRHNHCVPFVFCLEKKVNEKRKLATSPKCKENKKRANYHIHYHLYY